MTLRFIWMAYDVFFQTLWLAILKIPITYGANGVVFYMIYAGTLTNIPKAIVNYTYVQRKIFKIRIAKWQTFGATAISMMLYMCFGFLMTTFVYSALVSTTSVIVGVFITVVMLVVGGFFVYFPLTGFFGAFDKETLGYFEKSVEMAGYSKFLVKGVYWAVKVACRFSPLHDRFGPDPTVAHRQLDELVEIKRKAIQASSGTKTGE